MKTRSEMCAPLIAGECTIRHARPDEGPAIVDFIREYWSPNHIFVTHPEIHDYQHLVDGEMTYIVAECNQTGKLLCIQGYVVTNQTDTPDIWGTIWKVGNTQIPALGLRVHEYIKKAFPQRTYAAVGVNKTTFPIHKRLRHTIGYQKHYYRLAERETYRIAAIQQRTNTPIGPSPFSLKRLATWHDFIHAFSPEAYKDRKPYKDQWFLKRRYFEHPVYTYQVFGIDKDETRVDSVLIARELQQNDARILRIVDYIGLDDDLTGISAAVDELIQQGEYEYIDFYCAGIPDACLTQAGFKLKDANDPNIIPNYFEPFEQKNVDLTYVTSDPESFYAFKADSDQDRPNVLPTQ